MNESQVNNNSKAKSKAINKAIIKKVLSIFSWVLTAVTILLTVLVLVFGIISIKEGKMLKVFNKSISVVLTGSMEPVIMPNDVIIIDYVSYDSIEKDDIIVFYNPIENKNITHRVIEITSEGFKTKGDNNPVEDTFIVDEEHFIGKVTKYGSFGGIGGLMVNGRGVFFIVIIAIFLYFIISETINILKLVQDKRNKEFIDSQNKKKEELDKLREQMKEQMRKELLKELEEDK